MNDGESWAWDDEFENRVRKTPREDIMFLRQKEGMTAGKIRECLSLQALLNERSAQRVQDILVEALDALVANERIANKVKALRVTLAIDPVYPADSPHRASEPMFNLDDRQQRYASEILAMSKDTVKNWEKAAVDELLAYLEDRPVENPPVLQVSSPFVTPTDFDVADLRLDIPVSDLGTGDLVVASHMETSYAYLNRRTDEFYFVTKLDALSHGLDLGLQEILFQIPAANSCPSGLVVHLIVTGNTPVKEAQVTRYGTVATLSVDGSGLDLEQVVTSLMPKFDSRQAFRWEDKEPVPGGVYRVRWAT